MKRCPLLSCYTVVSVKHFSRQLTRFTLLLLALVTTSFYIKSAAAIPAPAVSTVLPNGMTLVTRPDRTSPRVALSLIVRLGAAEETTATAGWRRLLTEAMLRAASRDGQATQTLFQLQREAETFGGRVGATVSDDVIEFWAAGDSNHTTQLLDLLLKVVQYPRLSEPDVNAARRQLLARLDSEANEVARRAISALRSQLYRDARGELSAYGLPEYGTEASLTGLTTEKIRDYYKAHFRPSRYILSVAGDLDTAKLKERLMQAFTTADTAQIVGATPFFAQPDSTQPALVVRQMQTPGAWIFISYPVPGLKDADQPAIRVLAAALGESSTARLAQRLLTGRFLGMRPRASAAQVAVQYAPRRYSSEFIAFAQADAQNVDEVKNAMLDEVRKLREASLSATELSRAKNYVIGNWALEREALRDRAFHAGLAPALGAKSDTDWPLRVAAVTTADIRRVAGKYLKAYAVALIMPEE